MDRVNWRRADAISEGTLQMLRNQPNYGINGGVCYATKSGDCMHNRKCGNADMSSISVYVYRDSADLGALCAAKGKKFCLNCARYGNIELMTHVRSHVRPGCGNL